MLPICRPRFILLSLIFFTVIMIGINRYRSLAQILPPFQLTSVTVVSAASFEETAIAPESIAVAFGEGLASGTASATSTPLPFVLAGASVNIRDSAGITHNAGLFFASPGQINFLVPALAAPGDAVITVNAGSGITRAGTLRIAAVSPGLFSANANGQGAAAGFLLSVPQVGSPSFEPLSQFDQTQRVFVTRPLDLNRQTFQATSLFFVLYGSGIRRRPSLNDLTAKVGGIDAPVTFAGPQGDFVGLDQINIPISAELITKLTGRGRVNIALSIRGSGTSNTLEIEVAGPGGPIGPQITGFQPARALAGETVTISGNGFSPPDLTFVRVGGIEAPVTEASETQLKVKIPFGAETGPVAVRTVLGERASSEPLVIRTSISGVVEDTRRRPLPNITVFLRPRALTALPTSVQTNADGVFVMPVDLSEGPFFVDIDGANAVATPHFPRLRISPVILPNRDNQFTRPLTLQLATGAAIKLTNQNTFLVDSVSIPATSHSHEGDWVQAAEPNGTGSESEPAQTCLVQPGAITLDFPPNAQAIIPCTTTAECQDRSLYLTQVENSRVPVKPPLGHFSSTMVQISPFDAVIQPGGTLTIPNSDCLPANATVKLFQLRSRSLSVGIIFGDPAGQLDINSGSYVDLGPATVSTDAQRIVTAPGAIIEGGIYFASVARPTATIVGRIMEPKIDGFGSREPLAPVRRAMVLARGQETLTDGNGSFILRNVPVLGTDDRVAVEITYVRPEGRVERALRTDIAISANNIFSIGEVILSAPNVNRAPVIISSPSFKAEEGKRTDFNFVATDPDQGQTLQISLTGPPFASLLSRGGGGYTLRVAPGMNDAGEYDLTITATDNFNAISTQNVKLTVFNANQPPIANAQSVTLDEDMPKEIVLTASDPDRNALRFIIVSQPTHGTLIGTAPDLTYLPERNYFGNDSFTFKVNDGVADSNTATVTITINPVNDLPLLAMPGEQKVTAGNALNLAISATDVDVSDTLTLTADDLPQGATFNQVSVSSGFAGQFSWIPSAQQTGLYIVTFKASDNGSPPQTATRTLAISVLPQNAGQRTGMWNPTSGPNGGSAYALFINRSTVFAGTIQNGVYRSTDGGESWSHSSNGLPGSAPITTFAAIGDTVFAGTIIGVYRSDNNGDNWTSSSEGLSATGRYVLTLAAKGSILIAGTYSGVFISTDGGRNWRAASNGLPRRAPVLSLAVLGTALFAAVDSNGVFISNDDGQSWTPVNAGLPPNVTVPSLAVAGTQLFAGTAERGIYRTTNHGQNWSPVITSNEIISVDSLLAVGNNLYVGTDNGLYILPVSGQVSQLPRPVIDTYILALANGTFDNRTTIFAGTVAEGIFRSSDDGQTWRPGNSGFTSNIINALAFSNTEVFAATDLGVFAANLSQVQGQNKIDWQLLKTGLLVSSDAQSVTIAGSYLFASFSFGRVYRLNLQASAQERRWEPANNGLPTTAFHFTLGAHGSTVFVSTVTFPSASNPTYRVFRSTDLGNNWSPATNGLPNALARAFASLGTKVFAATEEGVFVSSNNGDSWTAANNGFPEKTGILSLAVSGNSIYAGTDSKGVYLSTNEGQSWGPINTNLPTNARVVSLLVNGSNLLAVTPVPLTDLPCPAGGVAVNGSCFGAIITGQFGGLFSRPTGSVFLSTNNGQNWAPIMSGLEINSVTTLGASGGIVIAGTNGLGVVLRQF